MKRHPILLVVLLFAWIFLAACEGDKVHIQNEKNASGQTHVAVIGSEIEGVYLASKHQIL